MRSLILFLSMGAVLAGGELQIRGTRFYMDGKPFPYTGLSFFNAIYSPNFNGTEAERTT